MKNTKIEWCDHTVNLWWGCSEVSEACHNCYARRMVERFKIDCWGKSPRHFRIDEAYAEIEKLNKSAKKRGVIETVFINSMSDFFDYNVIVEIRLRTWQVLRKATNLQFLILTKRAHILNNHLSLYKSCIPENVHFGITAENQQRLDERMAELSDFKGKLFLSCEPLLNQIELRPYLDKIDWVICGGETGRNAREFYPIWGQYLFEQTHNWNDYKREWEIEIPFFFKKFGTHAIVGNGEAWYFSTRREYPEWHSKGGAK